MGRIFDTEVRLHLSFIFLLAFIWVMDVLPGTLEGAPPAFSLLGIILASVVVREIAAIFAARRAGVPMRTAVLLPIGGIHLIDDPDPSEAARQERARRDTRAALAGPFVSLAIAVASASLLATFAPDVRVVARPIVTSHALLRSVVWVNLLLALINLLPAYPLDGGRIVRAQLSRRIPYVQATRRAASLGHLFAMAFIFAGLWDLWFTLIGALIFIGAVLEERSVVFQSVLETVRMEDVMLTDFATLSPADTLEDALSKAVHSLQDDFPVVRGTDMVGTVSRQGIMQALRSQGNGYVQSVMNRVGHVAQRHESLATALRRLSPRGLTLIPVVENERLVGIVTLQNLMRSMSLLAESRKLQRTMSQ
jgi:Zn-dependent protease